MEYAAPEEKGPSYKALGMAAAAGMFDRLPGSRAIIRGIDRLRLRPFPGLRPARAAKFHILAYHRIGPEQDDLAMAMTPLHEFREHMEALRRHFRVISLEQLGEELLADELRPGTVSITFDDGYEDNYRHAYPILRKLELPATIFLATDFIGTGTAIWHDRVLSALSRFPGDRLDWPEAGLVSLPTRSREAKAAAADAVLKWLKGFHPRDRDERIGELAERCGVPADTGGGLMLDWGQVAAMRAGGIRFGAHTRSHPILSRLSAAEIESEILGSKQAIEARLGEAVTTFAYPNGKPEDYGSESVAAVRRAGFRCGVTTIQGPDSGEGDPLQLRRYSPWESTRKHFLGRLLFDRIMA